MNQDSMCEASSQQEQLIQIGAHLQDVRNQQGLSLDDVAAKTLIQTRLLRAIEAGDMDALPEAVYVRGFVKRYADHLHLDGTKVAASFSVNTQTQPLPSSWNASAAAQLRPLHLYAAYVALIVAAVSGVSYLLSVLSPPTVTQQASSSNQEAIAQSDAEEGGSSAALGETEATESTASLDASEEPSAAAIASEESDEVSQSDGDPEAPVEVSLELVERSWLRVVVDGSEEFEGVLQEGTEQTWTAENEVTVRAGNAGGVLLAVNRQPAEVMGEPGSVSEQTFSPETPPTASN